MSSDLLLNLISEFIGIFVTVLIVDQLAKRRERKRWALAEQMTLAELCNLTGEYLGKFIPQNEKRKTYAQYRYGNYYGNPCVDADSKLYSYLEDGLAIIVDVSAIVSFAKTYANLQQLRRDNLHLLDPEIVSLILQIENETGWIVKKDYRDQEEERALFPKSGLLPAAKILRWLESKADQKITTVEYDKVNAEREKRISELLSERRNESL